MVNFVLDLPKLDCKTEKFRLERHFVRRKHRESNYLVCELRSTQPNVIRYLSVKIWRRLEIDISVSVTFINGDPHFPRETELVPVVTASVKG